MTDTLDNIGLILQQQGKLEEAKDYYQKSLLIRRKHNTSTRHVAKSEMLMGILLLQQNQVDLAIDHLSKSDGIETSSTNTEYRPILAQDEAIKFGCLKYYLGNALLIQGKLKEAELHSDQIIQHQSQFAFGYLLKIRILMKTNKLDEALKICEQAISIFPSFADIHVLLIDIGVKMKDQLSDDSLQKYTQRVYGVNQFENCLSKWFAISIEESIACFLGLKGLLPSPEFKEAEQYEEAIQSLLTRNFRNEVSGLPNYSQYNTDVKKYLSPGVIRCVVASAMANLLPINEELGQAKADDILRHYGRQLMVTIDNIVKKSNGLIDFGRAYHVSDFEYCVLIIPCSSLLEESVNALEIFERFMLDSVKLIAAITTCPNIKSEIDTYLQVAGLLSIDEPYDRANALIKEIEKDLKLGYDDAPFIPLNKRKNWKLQWMDVDGTLMEVADTNDSF